MPTLNDRTKAMFAAELIKMLDEMPFKRIRVAELCRRCGVATRLFYYHFKSKEELAAWVFYAHYTASYSTVSNAKGRALWEELSIIQFKRLWENRDFYRRLFMDGSGSSLRDYIARFSEKVNVSCLKEHLHTDELDDETLFMAKFYANGSTSVFVEWILGGYEISAEELTRLLLDIAPPLILESYSTSVGVPDKYEKGVIFGECS